MNMSLHRRGRRVGLLCQKRDKISIVNSTINNLKYNNFSEIQPFHIFRSFNIRKHSTVFHVEGHLMTSAMYPQENNCSVSFMSVFSFSHLLLYQNVLLPLFACLDYISAEQENMTASILWSQILGGSSTRISWPLKLKGTSMK